MPTQTPTTFRFRAHTLRVDVTRYQSPAGIALILTEVSLHNGATPYAVATVNLESARLLPHEVAIKDYNENAGVLEALIRAKVVEPPHIHVPAGFVKIPVCQLTEDFRKVLENLDF